MTLKYTDLTEVDLAKLGASVADWKATVDHLKTLAENARTGMQAKSDGARWAGQNADAVRVLIGKTTKEFEDLHGEANSIFQVLDDAHQELTQLQRSTKSLVSEAIGKGYRVFDNGDTSVSVIEYVGPGEPPKGVPEKELQHYADQITANVGRADDIDQSVKLALTRSHGKDPNNAGHKDYGSLNDAQIERALELAKKGHNMSDVELREFNRIMKFNGGEKDGQFATGFYKGLGGPEKTLEFYADITTDGTEKDASKVRLDAVKDFQQAMGPALANATDPDTKNHLPTSWGDEFRRLGTQQISWMPHQMPKPYGYQVLGGLMRYGNYDPSFINPIAEHLTQLHKEDPDKLLTHVGHGQGDTYGFNPSGKLGSGEDPLNSVLEALGHSPEASEKFFTDPPTAYNEDGTVKQDGKLGFTSYLDVFTDKDFQWNADSNNAYLYGNEDALRAARNVGPEALGHALESATTGRPYDSDDMGDAVRHTPERAGLVHDIVDKFGSDPELLKHNGDSGESGPLYAMKDSLGDITSEYMGDFQQAMYEENAGSDMFPTFGAAAGLDPGHAQKFLSEVGQDPHAYSAITAAQQAYTADVVNDVVNDPTTSTTSMDGRVRDAVAPGAAIAGIMSDSRADAIYQYHAASDADFNEAAADKAKWVSRILGMGVDKAAEHVPILGAPIGWASEDIQESVMKSIEQDTTTDAEHQAGGEYSHGRSEAIRSAQDAVDSAVRHNPKIDMQTADDLQRAARTAAGISHSDGAQWNSESHH
ncbi:hypothetical protein [Streptomyces sp. NPDC058142]|uniref:hypothetical protein n=1 Tax=Streptomyces sp. NPDC058142 TaxID=3346355 RepID=UPI0036E3F34B